MGVVRDLFAGDDHAALTIDDFGSLIVNGTLDLAGYDANVGELWGSGTTFSFTPDDNGGYTVTLTATDKDGDSDSASRIVTVGNVAPTTTLFNGGDVFEGSPAAVESSDASDPSSATPNQPKV
jgi:hypothetical protein